MKPPNSIAPTKAGSDSLPNKKYLNLCNHFPHKVKNSILNYSNIKNFKLKIYTYFQEARTNLLIPQLS